MEQKLNFLLDRNRQFDFQSAQMLDEITMDLKNNTHNVPAYPSRVKKPTKFGEYSKKTTTFGTTRQRSSSSARSTRRKYSCLYSYKTQSRYHDVDSAKMASSTIRSTPLPQELRCGQHPAI